MNRPSINPVCPVCKVRHSRPMHRREDEEPDSPEMSAPKAELDHLVATTEAIITPSDDHVGCGRCVEHGQIHYDCGVSVAVGTPDAYAEHVRLLRTSPATEGGGDRG